MAQLLIPQPDGEEGSPGEKLPGSEHRLCQLAMQVANHVATYLWIRQSLKDLVKWGHHWW